MPKITEQQGDFRGGMRSSVAPELLGPTEYAHAMNIELRTGRPTTRRGSRVLTTGVGNADNLQGVGVFNRMISDDLQPIMLFVLDELAYAWIGESWARPIGAPASFGPGALPDTTCIQPSEVITFLSAWSYVYMLRGSDSPPLRWNGGFDNDWDYVPSPAAGDAFPHATLGVYAYNRLWCVTEGDTLVASDLLSEAFDLTFHSWEVDSREGGRITGIVPWLNGSLIILKDTSVHLASNCVGDLSSFGLEVVDSVHGCPSVQGSAAVGNDVWYISDDGVRTVFLTDQNNVRMVDTTLSDSIRVEWARVAQGVVDRAQMILHDNYVIIAVPNVTDQRYSATRRWQFDYYLVYDLELRAWVSQWEFTSRDADFFARLVTVGDRLYGLTEYASILQLLSPGYVDLLKVTAAYLRFADTADVLTWTLPSAADILACDQGSWISLDVRFTGTSVGVGTITLLEVTSDNGDVLRITAHAGSETLSGIFYLSGPVVKWNITTVAVPQLFDGRKHSVKIHMRQTGSDKVLWSVDANPVAIDSYSVDVDRRAWFYDLTGTDVTIVVKCEDSVVEMDLWNAEIRDDGDDAVFAARPLRGDDGAAIRYFRDALSAVDAVGTGFDFTDWKNNAFYGSTKEVAIEARMLTRGYTLGSPTISKRRYEAEVAVAHVGADLSVAMVAAGPGEKDTLIDGRTYDQTVYDIHGKGAWDGSGATWMDPHRQEYGPWSIPASFTWPDYEDWVGYGWPVGGGIELDAEQTHVLRCSSIRSSTHMQLDVRCMTGRMSIDTVLMSGLPRPTGQRR